MPVGAAAGGLVAYLLIGGWPGMVVGAITALAFARALGRLEPASVRRIRRAAAADLPFAADLLAAALRSGVPTERAVRAVGEGLGAPLGRDLLRVADGLCLGLEPAQAWRPLRAVPGGDRIADAVERSADSGAAVARALGRLADDLRAARAGRVEAAAQRVSVLIVLPMGLCFLPAFVFAGIVPVIVAVLGDVLR